MKTKPETGRAKHALTALFDDSDSAERAYAACESRGYEVGEINVVISEGTRKKLLEADDEAKAELARRKAEGGKLGGPTGGRAGLLMTIFAAVGAAVAIPAVGVAAGPIAVALAAAGAAGVTGGLISLLGNWGVPDERIYGYETAIKKGAILMMVEPRSEEDVRVIAEEWKRLGGRDVVYR